MSLSRILRVVYANISRNKRAFFLSSVGLVIGVATLTFFLQLAMGVQSGVINKIYPVNQIEVEPKSVALVGLRQDILHEGRRGKELLEELEALPGVKRVYPKMRSKFQARLWGGASVFGYAARTEAFLDGLDGELLQDELLDEEEGKDKLDQPGAGSACFIDEECRIGFECQEGRCQALSYGRRFSSGNIALSCEEDGLKLPDGSLEDGCPGERTCVFGLCEISCGVSQGKTPPEGASCEEGLACVPLHCGDDGGLCQHVCRPSCESSQDCQTGEHCLEETGVCERLRCELLDKKDQMSEDPLKTKGRLTDYCGNDLDPSHPACEPLPCPGSSYCAPRNVESREGYCEESLPVVLSPILLELLNSAAASSLGMQKIDGLHAMRGVNFQIQLGSSYFSADLPTKMQAVKRAEIVGFSTKADEFGVMIPRDAVEAFNARYKGKALSETYDTFIIETYGNEDVSNLIAKLDEHGLSLSSRSKDAQKAGDLLFILTVIFSFISLVILFVAGVNITHTFLTLVTERRHEIGIMRAVGARKGDIAKLFLGEALILGLFGGILGSLLGYLVTRLVNFSLQHYLEDIPFKPDDFFAYDALTIIGAILFACVFCILGAAIPARKAASIDPARVLTS